jgi:hypothetical protein
VYGPVEAFQLVSKEMQILGIFRLDWNVDGASDGQKNAAIFVDIKANKW